MQIPEASEEGCEDWCLPCLGKARAGIDASPDPCEGRALACILAVGARGSGDVRICEYACLRGLLAEVRDPCQQVLLASAWRGVLVHPPGMRLRAGAGTRAREPGSRHGTGDCGSLCPRAGANPKTYLMVCACACPSEILAYLGRLARRRGGWHLCCGIGADGLHLWFVTGADRRAKTAGLHAGVRARITSVFSRFAHARLRGYAAAYLRVACI